MVIVIGFRKPQKGAKLLFRWVCLQQIGPHDRTIGDSAQGPVAWPYVLLALNEVDNNRPTLFLTFM